jgi:hypothetical protein
MSKDADVVAICRQILGTKSIDLQRLQGGINSFVYRCSNERKNFIVKLYDTPDESNLRCRYTAELAFLQLSALCAPEFTPKIIDHCQSNQFIAMEEIEGERYSSHQDILQSDINSAIEFIKMLNIDKDICRHLIHLPAAEGYSCLTDHLSNIRSRIARMNAAEQGRIWEQELLEILQILELKLIRVETSVHKQLTIGTLEDKVEERLYIVSPSDFGFHNAIRRSGKACFFDFEHSGWDDPAKLILDFYLQPRVSTAQYGYSLLRSFKPEQRANIAQRCKVLLPILRLKWICIILGVMDKQRELRLRRHKGFSHSNEAIRHRLCLAREYLDMVDGEVF